MKKRKLSKTEHLVVRITPVQLKMILNRIKEQEGITISDFIRSAINKQIYNNQQEL